MLYPSSNSHVEYIAYAESPGPIEDGCEIFHCHVLTTWVLVIGSFFIRSAPPPVTHVSRPKNCSD